MGTALALRYRHRYKKGLWIDVGMYQLGCYTVSEYILDWLANGRLGERLGNRHPSKAPQGCYPCAGDDQWCVVSVDDEEWAAQSGHRQTRARSEARFATIAIVRAPRRDRRVRCRVDQGPKFEAMERLQGAQSCRRGPRLPGRTGLTSGPEGS
jgi:crotonobetainyl-CoA:carnitine CoA-transferase CaiB-like acyl-CoA transferase